MSTYYVPGTIISTKDHQNRQENSCSHKAHILGTKTIKLLEKNVGGSFMTLDIAIISWIGQQRYSKKRKYRQSEFHEILKLLFIKGHFQQSIIHRIKENICNHISNDVLIFRIHEEFLQINNKKRNYPIEKCTKDK